MSSRSFNVQSSDSSWSKDMSNMTSIFENYPSREPFQAPHQSEDSNGADGAPKAPADPSQAWYDGMRDNIKHWVRSAVTHLPLTKDMDPAERDKTVKEVQASVQSQWPAIMRRAGLATRPYDAHFRVVCTLDKDQPVHQLPGQEQAGKVDMNLHVQFLKSISLPYPTSEGLWTPYLSRDIEIRAENITFPIFHTVRTATKQALTEFLESNWFSSHATDQNKAHMQETVRTAVNKFSATKLFELEDELAVNNKLGDSNVTRVKAEISMKSVTAGFEDGLYTLFADYKGQHTKPLTWGTSASKIVWLPLQPMRARISTLRLWPTTSKSA